jgi:hypothetical protein
VRTRDGSGYPRGNPLDTLIVIGRLAVGRRAGFEVAILILPTRIDDDFPVFSTTRRVSGGRIREDLKRDVTLSLTYVSG